MTAPSREPTEAMRLLADELYELWRIRNKIDWCNAAARALAEQDAAARREAREIDDAMVDRALEGICISPFSYSVWRPYMRKALALALTPEPPSEKENEGG